MKAARTGQNWKCDRNARHGPGPPSGLRERKKARTRASIREHALRLFREQTYQGTTVEQIAAAAEVSPSTFFRYFPTKEDIVLQDDMDTRMIEALERQPAGLGPLSAVRAATREVFTSYTQADLDLLGETTALTMTVPEIRARAMNEFARSISVIGEALAKRAGRPADDLAVRTTAGAIIGVVMSITMPWEDWSKRPADHRGHVRAHRPGPRPAGSRAPAVRRGQPPCPDEVTCCSRRSWCGRAEMQVTRGKELSARHKCGLYPGRRAASGQVYPADPPAASRMRSVSRSMEVCVPPALPNSCWRGPGIFRGSWFSVRVTLYPIDAVESHSH